MSCVTWPLRTREYEVKFAEEIQFDGTHPKMICNKDGAGTRRMRHASPADDPPENQRHTWQLPAPVGWERMDPDVREVFATHNYGSATLALTDSRYADDLKSDSYRDRVRRRAIRTGRAAAGPAAALNMCSRPAKSCSVVDLDRVDMVRTVHNPDSSATNDHVRARPQPAHTVQRVPDVACVALAVITAIGPGTQPLDGSASRTRELADAGGR